MTQTLPHTSPRLTGTAPAPTAITHVVPGTWLPMTQNWIHNQLAHLGPKFTNHVVCDGIENSECFPVDGLHVRQRAGRLGRVVSRFSKAYGRHQRAAPVDHVIRTTGAQVLHSHFGSVAWENLEVARRHNIAHVATFYGMDVNYLPQNGWMSRYEELFDVIDAILCEGPYMAQEIVDLGCDPSKVHVQHLGVRVDSIPYEPLDWDGVSPLRVMLAATIREKKGMPNAIDALGRFHREHPVEITLVGDAGNSDSSRAEKQRVLEMIAYHNLGAQVRMPGNLTYAGMMREARSHHIFMHPSVTASDGQTEGGAPVVLIDMAASGRLLLSSRHCDIPEIIEHKRTGRLADEHDIEGLVDQLRAFASTPEQWRFMADAAREHMEIEFNCKTLGPRLGRIYRALLGGGCMPVSDWSPRTILNDDPSIFTDSSDADASDRKAA